MVRGNLVLAIVIHNLHAFLMGEIVHIISHELCQFHMI